MYTQKSYPEPWRESFGHFIKKPDGNFRPISLTSCLCKLFESFLKNRLQWWAENNNLLPENQNGFRKGKSCADNLVKLSLKIEEALIEKKSVLTAFLDIQDAFDNVIIDILLTILAKLGCPKNLIQFVKFITHERTIFTCHDKKPRSTFKGVPQGGVLSPLLYLLYVIWITKGVKKCISISQFADDIIVFLKCFATKKSKTMLQNAIIKIKENLREIGLELTPSKTVFIHFNNKKIVPGSVAIQLEEHIIKSSHSVRHLGIYFDYNVSLGAH